MRGVDARAHRLVDEVAGRIDRWEVHLYNPQSALPERWVELSAAAAKLDEALALRPEATRTLYYKAKALTLLWRNDEALALLDRALAREDDGGCRLLRARIHQVLYLTLQFDRLCRAGVSLRGDVRAEVHGRAFVRDVEHLQGHGKLKPGDALYARALQALGEGDVRGAKALAQDLLANDSNDAEAYELLAAALLRPGEGASALLAKEMLEQALRIKRSSFRLHLELAVACRLAASPLDSEEGRPLLEEAEGACRRALLIAGQPRAFAALAEVLVLRARSEGPAGGLKVLEEALACLHQGLMQDGRDAVLHLDKGTVHYEVYRRSGDAGHGQSALEHWAIATSREPGYRSVLAPFVEELERSGSVRAERGSP